MSPIWSGVLWLVALNGLLFLLLYPSFHGAPKKWGRVVPYQSKTVLVLVCAFSLGGCFATPEPPQRDVGAGDYEAVDVDREHIEREQIESRIEGPSYSESADVEQPGHEPVCLDPTGQDLCD